MRSIQNQINRWLKAFDNSPLLFQYCSIFLLIFIGAILLATQLIQSNQKEIIQNGGGQKQGLSIGSPNQGQLVGVGNSSNNSDSNTPQDKSIPANANQNANRPKNVPSNCRVVDIPYNTTYQNVDWLDVGETSSSYGFNGYNIVCSDSRNNTTINPVDKVIHVRIRQKQTSSYSSSPSTATTTTPAYSPNYAAKNKCDSDYSRAMAQINNSGAGDSSAIDLVKYTYNQCLKNAGF